MISSPIFDIAMMAFLFMGFAIGAPVDPHESITSHDLGE